MKTNEKSLVSANTNDSWGSSVTAEDIPCSEDYTMEEYYPTAEVLASEDQETVKLVYTDGVASDDEQETGNISSELVCESDDLSTELGVSTDSDSWSCSVSAESISCSETDKDYTTDSTASGSELAVTISNLGMQYEEDKKQITSTGLVFRMKVKQAYCSLCAISAYTTVCIVLSICSRS